jgi:hypothetical protein
MSLRIHQLNTVCHVPRQRQEDAGLVDRLARGRFARDLGDHLGPSLGRQPAIVRIRRLAFRVIIPAHELNEDTLSLRWRQEFGKALFTALAYPTGARPDQVFRAESVAGFIASAIRELLDGTAQTKWQFAEFESFFRSGNTQAALGLICEWPQHTMSVLLELAELGILDRLLVRFDDLAIERLFAVLARSADSETEPLTVADLIATARLVLAYPPDKTVALPSRANALTLFVKAHRQGQTLQSPRVLFHALLALAVLLNEEVFWPGAPSDEPVARRLPPSVLAILESIYRAVRDQVESTSETGIRELTQSYLGAKTPGGPQTRGKGISLHLPELEHLLIGLTFALGVPGQIQRTMHGKIAGSQTWDESMSPHLAELNQLLGGLRNELRVPPPFAPPKEVRWISSEWCGLFFLASTLVRLGWISSWKQLSDFQTGGVSCLIAGLVLAITEKFDPAVLALDPGVALFAGYVHDPDLMQLRKVFQESPREARLRVLGASLPHDAVEDAAENWQGTFDLLSEKLLRDFASRIRGFRQSTRRGILSSFIARPGRLLIEPERIVVFPSPSPFNVALHISGIDEPVDSPVWLGGRRLEFHLEDL